MFLADVFYKKFAKSWCIIIPPNVFYVTALSCKMLIAILVLSSLLKTSLFYFGNVIVNFYQNFNFLKDLYVTIINF